MSEENRLSRRGFLGAAAALGAAGLIGPLGCAPATQTGGWKMAILDPPSSIFDPQRSCSSAWCAIGERS